MMFKLVEKLKISSVPEKLIEKLICKFLRKLHRHGRNKNSYFINIRNNRSYDSEVQFRNQKKIILMPFCFLKYKFLILGFLGHYFYGKPTQ